jgi:hypothetical protein
MPLRRPYVHSATVDKILKGECGYIYRRHSYVRACRNETSQLVRRSTRQFLLSCFDARCWRVNHGAGSEKDWILDKKAQSQTRNLIALILF